MFSTLTFVNDKWALHHIATAVLSNLHILLPCPCHSKYSPDDYKHVVKVKKSPCFGLTSVFVAMLTPSYLSKNSTTPL